MRQCTSITDRQTDTDIVAEARDVYITSCAKNATKEHSSPVLMSQARIRPLLCPVIITTSCVTMRRYRTDVDGCCFITGLVMRQNAIEFTNDPTLIVSLSSFNTPNPRRTELCGVTVTLHTRSTMLVKYHSKLIIHTVKTKQNTQALSVLQFTFAVCVHFTET